ncbi:hypothetical protein ACHAWF_011275 [Thalassiosira exigua]
MNSYMDFDSLVQQKEINLNLKKLCDADLVVLAKVLRKSKVLKILFLYQNSITLAEGQFIDALAKNQSLRTLYLERNKIGDEGANRLAKVLKENDTLEVMHLNSNEIGDEGAKSLADALQISTSLKTISLGSNQISDVGAQHLAKSLTENNTLREIWINFNSIGDRGGQSFVDALKSNHSMDKLCLWDNNISNSVMKRITAILHDPKRKALTSKVDKQERCTRINAGKGFQWRWTRIFESSYSVNHECLASNDKRKIENVEPIQGSDKRQKNSNADEAAGSVPPPVVPNSSAKTVSVKKEEETEDKDERAEPAYVTYKVLRPLLEKVKRKSSSAIERELYGHLKSFVATKGLYLLMSDFDRIQDFMGDFEQILQDQANSNVKSNDQEDANLYRNLLESAIKKCKKTFPLKNQE